VTDEMTKAGAAPLSHTAIIARHGGTKPVSALLEEQRETVKGWSKNNSIPADRWWRCAKHKIATLEELAHAAARRAGKEG
jgi:hypothetical protein